MSKVFDIKTKILILAGDICKNSEQAKGYAVDLFLEAIDMCAEDFEYEFDVTPLDYLFEDS